MKKIRNRAGPLLSQIECMWLQTEPKPNEPTVGAQVSAVSGALKRETRESEQNTNIGCIREYACLFLKHLNVTS